MDDDTALFNTFFDQAAPTRRGGVPGRQWVPSMDLVETADQYVLPAGVNPDRVQAHFDRGVLEIRISKPEQKKPRQVRLGRQLRLHDPQVGDDPGNRCA